MASEERRNCRDCGQPMYFGGMYWWHKHSETQFCNIPSLPTMHKGEPENDAEDRVRCAAPELLAALKEITAIMHQLGHKDTVCVIDARAAIAKAEGLEKFGIEENTDGH
jgi:hypothetical protein